MHMEKSLFFSGLVFMQCLMFKGLDERPIDLMSLVVVVFMS